MNAIQWPLLWKKQGAGKKRILEIKPEKLHQRTPIFIGSEEDVKIVEEFMAREEVEVNKA